MYEKLDRDHTPTHTHSPALLPISPFFSPRSVCFLFLIDLAYPTDLIHSNEITPLFKHLSPSTTYRLLEHGSRHFYNRFYDSQFGQQSSEWIYSELSEIISKSKKSGVSISLEVVPHRFKQDSIVARFLPRLEKEERGKGPIRRLPGPRKYPIAKSIVLGAHQDSSNYLFPR